MLENGEDSRFIVRRIIIIALEDIDLVDLRIVWAAKAYFDVCEWLGRSKCHLSRAHMAIFGILTPKSNSTY
jgi:putative ATPase